MLFVFECEAAAGGALRCEHLDGTVREIAVGEHGQELLPDGAGDAHDCDGGSVLLKGHADFGGDGESGFGSD